MKNVIFIPAVISTQGEKKLRSTPLLSKIFDYSIRSWKHFAKNHNCEVVILDQPLMDSNIASMAWQRYYVLDLLENSNIAYDQVLIVDADTIVHPECPNFFEMTDGLYTGVHDGVVYEWVMRSVECYSKALFNDYKLDIWSYINGGFQIINTSHKPNLNKFKQFYLDNRDLIYQCETQIKLGTDQTPMNFFLQMNRVPTKILPYEFNMMGLNLLEGLTDDLPFTKFGWVYHFNGIPDTTYGNNVEFWMNKTYNKLYTV
jgi:lipopolysaccharide biosynthesis glycosyltransferase